MKLTDGTWGASCGACEDCLSSSGATYKDQKGGRAGAGSMAWVMSRCRICVPTYIRQWFTRRYSGLTLVALTGRPLHEYMHWMYGHDSPEGAFLCSGLIGVGVDRAQEARSSIRAVCSRRALQISCKGFFKGE